MSASVRAVGTIQRRRKRKPCVKVRYRDREAANDALRSIREHSERETIPCRAYFCSRCNGYHLTSREQLEAVEVTR